jgi:site-specific recombinase XerD
VATIKTVIKKKAGKPALLENGEIVIYHRYTHNSQTLLLSTGVKVLPEHFDEKNNSYPVKGPGKASKNSLISQARQNIEKVIISLQNEGTDPTIAAVKAKLQKTKKSEVQEVYRLFDEYIQYSQTVKTQGTVKLIKRAKADFTEFCTHRRKTPKLQEIDLKFYDGYVKYLTEKRNMKNNTVGKCIKDFKAFLNFCKRRGYTISPEVRKFKVLREQTPIIYLTQKELETLWQFEFSTDRHSRCRDLWCLQAFTGLRWSDLSRLGKQHITGNVVRITAFKTKKQIVVPLQSKAIKVLEKYGYQVPDVTEQEINRTIKEACRLAGIDSSIEVPVYQGGQKTFTKLEKWKKVSTHTAVKTFITHCAENGISPKVVATITGKTVDVILKHYYGTNEEQIISEIEKAFG